MTPSLATQLAVVLPLQPGAAHLVGAHQRGAGGLGLGDLVVGDGREVAEDLGGVGAAGARVAADGGGLGCDAGEVLGALADLQGLLGGGLVGDGDGLVGRSGPAGLGRLGVAQPHLGGHVLGPEAQHPGEPGEDGPAAVLHLHQVGAVGRDDQAGLVVGERHAAGVEDGAAGGRGDDLLDVVVGGFGSVRVALADLQVPQSAAEGEQQRDDQDLNDDQPDGHARGAAGLGAPPEECGLTGA
ncbi:hypothetical protein GCM10020000_54700 [Streptomyces olivoverticillatus]